MDLGNSLSALLDLKQSLSSDLSVIWETEPVDIITFLTKFQNKNPFPEQAKLLLNWFGSDPKNFDTRFKEIIAVWGMGSGKDFIASAGTSYMVYKLMCLKSPQAYFNMGNSESIDIVNVSFNAAQAKYVYFKKLQNCIRETVNPETGQNWFGERGMILTEGKSKKDIQTTVINFPKNIRAFSLNSKSNAPEGVNIILSIFDEVGRFAFQQAEDLYNVLSKNTVSRYGAKGKTVLISYPEAEDDFLMHRYYASLEDSEVYSSRKATWEVNLNRKKTDFDKLYRINPEDSRKKFECIPPRTKTGFITFPEKIEECADKSLASPIDFSYVTTIRQVAGMKDCEYIGVKIDKIKGDDRTRFLHGDPALLHDSFVIACGYMETTDAKEINGFIPTVTKVVIDIIIEVKPERNKPVDIINVKDTILEICRHFPNIQKVTFDKWNSADMIQSLINEGIQAEDMTFSNTQQVNIYTTFRNLLHSNRIRYLDNEKLKKELKELQLINNNKVDHPSGEGHSKDIADAVVAVCSHLMNEEPEGVLDSIFAE